MGASKPKVRYMITKMG